MITVNFKFKPDQEVWIIGRVSDYHLWDKAWDEHYAVLSETIKQCSTFPEDMSPMYYTTNMNEVKECDIFATKQEAIDKLIELL